MTDEDVLLKPPQPKVYEEWIAHPNRFAFVTRGADYAGRPGWWRTGWEGDLDALAARGAKPGVFTL